MDEEVRVPAKGSDDEPAIGAIGFLEG